MPHEGGRTIKANRKMTEDDVKKIVNELEKWKLGERDDKLTWKALGDQFGFTKQAMSTKRPIKAAWDEAHAALANPAAMRKAQEIDADPDGKKALRAEIERYKKLEMEWHAKWQRIAYHAKAGWGISIDQLDQPLPDANRS